MKSDDIRSWLWILYGIVLLVGTFMIVQWQPSYTKGLETTRDLEANRMLQPGDVSPTVLNGLFLVNQMKKGKNLQPSDVSNFPIVAAKQGSVPAAISIKGNLVASGALNAGTRVRLCSGDSIAIESATVRTVFCAPSESDCIAIIDLPVDKSNAIAGAFGKSTAPTVQPVQLGDQPCK